MISMIFYIIELSILSTSGQHVFLEVVEYLMLAAASLTFIRIALGDSTGSGFIALCDSTLFGLSMGWSCFAAFGIDDSDRLSLFFSFNGLIIIFLTYLAVKERQCLASNETLDTHVHANHLKNQNAIDAGVSSADDISSLPNVRHDERDQYRKHSLSNVENGKLNGDGKSLTRLGLMGDIFDGFRVNLEKLPISNPGIPHDVPWESFSYVEHRVDSSSCHIYSAFWRGIAVIIKLIKADRVTSAMAVAEFETELSVLSRLDHPNIVKLLGSGRQPNRFLILELLDGGSLSHSLGLRADSNHKLNKRKFNYLETLQLARSLASSLDYLHNQWHSSIHVIHRDLKPDNIGFTADGKLKLFDFGLCACVRTNTDRRDQYRLTGNTGTLRYMAPEVAMGRNYNCSVDVYSFGVIVWQVLRSKVPFRDMGKKAYLQEVVFGGKRPAIDKSWPAGFSSLLQKCWHADKDVRPAFSQVVADLDALIHDAQGQGAMSSSTYIRHKMKAIKAECFACSAHNRGLLTIVASLLAVAVVIFLLLGGEYRVIGSSLAVVASSMLFLVAMSHVRSRVHDTDGESVRTSSSGFMRRISRLVGRGRRRHSAASMLEGAERMSGGALSSDPSPSSSVCVSVCMGVDDHSVAFNPLSPHSLHHSSEGDELEGYYRRAEFRDSEMSRPPSAAVL